MALPLTIVCGYLGSGKTTLINAALAAGRERLAVICADASGVDNLLIDRARTANHAADAPTGGCACCAPDRDLWSAVNAVLEMDPPPDRLLIEASGFANPASMMRIALSDPALSDGGIVAVADAFNLKALLADPDLAPVVERQFEAASAIVLARAAEAGPDAIAVLEARFPGKIITPDFALFTAPPANLPAVHGLVSRETGRRIAMHSVRAFAATGPCDIAAAEAFVRDGAGGAWRIKGVLRGCDGRSFTLSKAGARMEIRAALPHEEAGAIAAIGLSDAMDLEEVDRQLGAIAGVSRSD